MRPGAVCGKAGAASSGYQPSTSADGPHRPGYRRPGSSGRQRTAFPNRAHKPRPAAYDLLGSMRGLDPLAFPASHPCVCHGEKCAMCEKIGRIRTVS